MRYSNVSKQYLTIDLKLNKSKIYKTLGYIVSLILLNLGHVFHFHIIGRMWTYTADDVKAKLVSQVQGD